MIMTRSTCSPCCRRAPLDAIDEHLRQDSRGVQFAGLFGADGPGSPATSEACRPTSMSARPHMGRSHGRTPCGSRTTRSSGCCAAAAERRSCLCSAGNVDETSGDRTRRRAGARAWPAAGVLLCPAGRSVASVRAKKRVEEVNQRVQRIVAGDLARTASVARGGEPFSKARHDRQRHARRDGNHDPCACRRRQRHRP